MIEMDKFVEFRYATSTSLKHFRDQVQAYLNDGWHLHGEPFYHDGFFVQFVKLRLNRQILNDSESMLNRVANEQEQPAP